MGTLTLKDIASRLEHFGEGSIVYARKPWLPSSEALVLCVVPEDLDPRDGLDYFVDIDGFRQIVDMDNLPNVDRVCEIMIHYAVHDA